MIELKPCPFCGAPAWVGRRIDYFEEMDMKTGKFIENKKLFRHDQISISCSNDKCEMDPFITKPTLEMAAEIWNRRADDDDDENCPESEYVFAGQPDEDPFQELAFDEEWNSRYAK